MLTLKMSIIIKILQILLHHWIMLINNSDLSIVK